MKEYKLIVAGGRDFNDAKLLSDTLHKVAEDAGERFAISVVSGMAPGADSLAYVFAKSLGITCYPFPAQWSTHGKQAGPIRNKQMAEFSDGLLAFWDGKSKGTEHMIEIMRAMGKPVHVVKYGHEEAAEAAPAAAEASEVPEAQEEAQTGQESLPDSTPPWEGFDELAEQKQQILG